MTTTPAVTTTPVMPTTPVIVGGGLAGLVTALRCAELGLPVTVLCAGPLGAGTASGWAQGGIAAAVGADDHPGRHAADTIAAGAGLCDPEAVDRVTAAAPGAIDGLTALGVRFDRHPDGTLRLGLEGAHARHRIVHARGDGTGAEVMRAVVAAVRSHPAVHVVERARAGRLRVEDEQVVGVDVRVDGRPVCFETDAVVLATGGVGALWQHTTNPLGSRGQGLAMAARAGAELRDLEMVQFHPTALDVGLDPMPLVSEAVRGAGALLVDAAGRPLTDDPLGARDVVSRAVWQASRHGQAYLDARRAIGARFGERFPAVAAACHRAGIDPASGLIPVRPAAHYHCGGVVVDPRGRTTVPGLWAVGEVSSTGLHGANRLASNSLLEAVVFGGLVAEDLGQRPRAMRDPAPRLSRVPGGLSRAPRGGPAAAHPADAPDLPALRARMSDAVGLIRSGTDLARLTGLLHDVVAQDPDGADDAALVAFLVTQSALQRCESRGGHLRTDHPPQDTAPRHTATTLWSALAGGDARSTALPPESCPPESSLSETSLIGAGA
ncbi:L-aspartate oxidase [Ornithinimicrobium sp. F0845]|uniref:L-aspartate oxidase n=1 Tax=Ornithinimicrobium sp. F0845 TaxID=2926412 RepID=UPI001FF5C28E|nr:L-aspartate oxidase [Ornithinimicrobium sp. F0845]MCK0113274.1 L-aspartate oxidase [Ornithinimicrobium sp. F0845]